MHCGGKRPYQTTESDGTIGYHNRPQPGKEALRYRVKDVTVAELAAAFHEAVDHYLEVCEKLGQEPQKSY